MSRGKRTETETQPGIVEIHDKRHTYEIIRTEIDPTKAAWDTAMEAVGFVKITAAEWKLTGAPSDKAWVRDLRDAAAAWLAGRCLPGEPLVYYDAGRDGLPLLPAAERAQLEAGKRPPGDRRWGRARLEGYMKRRGFEPLDSERLAARVVEMAAEVMNEHTPRDRLIDCVRKLTSAADAFNRMEDADAAAAARGKKPKGKQWAAQLALEMVAADPEASARALWDGIPEYEEAGDEPDENGMIIYRDGNKLVCVEDGTGREDSISRRAWDDYMRKAKKPMRG